LRKAKMANKILKCEKCGRYTMLKKCCGVETVTTKPAKFRMDDRYGEYRRKAKCSK
jgi:rRNA maturation protein Nop10